MSAQVLFFDGFFEKDSHLNAVSVFYFMLKALLVPEVFTFLSLFFVYGEKRLDKKVRLIPQLMTSQTGQQVISIWPIGKFCLK